MSFSEAVPNPEQYRDAMGTFKSLHLALFDAALAGYRFQGISEVMVEKESPCDQYETFDDFENARRESVLALVRPPEDPYFSPTMADYTATRTSVYMSLDEDPDTSWTLEIDDQGSSLWRNSVDRRPHPLVPELNDADVFEVFTIDPLGNLMTYRRDASWNVTDYILGLEARTPFSDKQLDEELMAAGMNNGVFDELVIDADEADLIFKRFGQRQMDAELEALTRNSPQDQVTLEQNRQIHVLRTEGQSVIHPLAVEPRQPTLDELRDAIDTLQMLIDRKVTDSGDPS